jgi:hypothetical protein
MIAKSLICASSAWNLQFQKEHNMNCLYDRWVQALMSHPIVHNPNTGDIAGVPIKDLDSRTESFYQSWSSLTLARISFLTLSYVNAICKVKWK